MISIQNLVKSYDGQNILAGIDLDINKGETVAIIGPSGSGKSTFLRSINFLEHPDSGAISIGGHHVDAEHTNNKEIAALRRKTSFVFQNYALFANKTALDNIAEGLISVQKKPKPEALEEAKSILNDIGLLDKAHNYPVSLSGGQQQRIGIGRAMASHSPVMLLDEPTSALDPEWVEEVLQLIQQLAKRKQTMIIVTHEMGFAQQVADRVVFMDGGKIIEQGSSEKVFNAPEDPRTQTFLRNVIKGEYKRQ